MDIRYPKTSSLYFQHDSICSSRRNTNPALYRHMVKRYSLVWYKQVAVMKTYKKRGYILWHQCLIYRYLSFAALTVRFITRRFIGDYDPDLGKFWEKVIGQGRFVKVSNIYLIYSVIKPYDTCKSYIPVFFIWCWYVKYLEFIFFLN